MVHGEPYGAASDAWSVGLLAHEILTLKHPFCGGSLAVMLQNIVAGKYDRRPLAEAPYPQELKNVATGEELLCEEAPDARGAPRPADVQADRGLKLLL